MDCNSICQPHLVAMDTCCAEGFFYSFWYMMLLCKQIAQRVTEEQGWGTCTAYSGRTKNLVGHSRSDDRRFSQVVSTGPIEGNVNYEETVFF